MKKAEYTKDITSLQMHLVGKKIQLAESNDVDEKERLKLEIKSLEIQIAENQ